jgi:hypothetical protein
MADDVSQTVASRDGTGFRVPLTCPKCNAAGWIEWQNLSHSIRCPKCSDQFLIAPNGKFRSLADLPQTRFECPRCGQSGSIPTMLAERGAECIGCKLRLVAGPDQKLHGVKEAKELRRAAQMKKPKHGLALWLERQFQTADGRVRKGAVAVWSIGAAAMFVAMVMLLFNLFDNSLETQAKNFTSACLAGDWSAAEESFADDDVQLAEFNRWRMRHFTSIIDEHRPAGDSVRIDVESTNGEALPRILNITLTSDFLGTRSHTQCWNQQDGRWQFEPQKTLEATDGVVGIRRRPTQK